MAKHKDSMHNLFPRWSRGQSCRINAKKIVKSVTSAVPQIMEVGLPEGV